MSSEGKATITRIPVDFMNLELAADRPDIEDDHCYLDTVTGAVIYIENETWNELEEQEVDEPEQLDEETAQAFAVLTDDRDRFRWIPRLDGQTSYGFMADFVESAAMSSRIRQRLAKAIQGKGAFRMFRQVVENEGDLLDTWYRYKNERETRWILDWLKEEGFAPEEDPLKKLPPAPEPENRQEKREIDKDRLDDTVLALLWLTRHGDAHCLRAWKSHDWDVMNRLHEKGCISNPRGKAKSVALSQEGARLSEELFWKLFGQTD